VLVVGCVLASLALVAALHALRPDVDPIRDDLSLYAVGPFGALMAAAFIALGTSVFVTATVVLDAPAGTRTLRLNRTVLAISGIGGALVAAFPSAARAPQTPTDHAELVASLVFFVGFGTSSLVISLNAWTGFRASVAAFLSGAFGLVFLCMLFGPDEIHGILMRIAMACVVAWLVLAASFNR